jgi:hypothetical protein
MRRRALHELKASRRTVIAGAAGIVFGGRASSAPPIHPSNVKAGPRAGARGFDFLHGRWRVTHRRLKSRLVDSTDWEEFPGTLEVRPILHGLGNIDENVLEAPAGEYLATSLRVFEPQARRWSIYWVDGRGAGIDRPVVGTFEGRVGRFYNDDVLANRPIKVRFTYRDLGALRASWDQAFSADGGHNWEVNWTMDFFREGVRK